MTMTDTDNTLKVAIERRKYVWLTGPDFTFMGFVLGLSDTLVLFQRFRDFSENGYAVIARRVVEEISSDSPALRFFEHMMAGEGLLSQVGLRLPISISSIAQTLESVRASRLFVTIVCAEHHEEGSDLEHDVGEVLAVGAEAVTLRQVSASGVFLEKLNVEFSEIERIEFGSPYLLHLQKYAK